MYFSICNGFYQLDPRLRWSHFVWKLHICDCLYLFFIQWWIFRAIRATSTHLPVAQFVRDSGSL